MAKEVLLFNGAAIPAHIAAKMAEAPTNIEDRISIPSLGTAGKGTWTITLNGETTKLQKRDAEGDLIDLPIFRGVILGYAPRRGRAYYPGAYDKDKPGKPTCWSLDGITRDPRVSEPPTDDEGTVVTKCAACPWSVKGSKVNELNKAVTACGEHRMVVVVPHNKPDFPALRLKLSITSDFDGKSPELEAEDWFAFSNYTSAMRARGVTNTAFVVTKMRFDPNKEYPKIIFQWGGWADELGEGVQDKLLERANSDEVKNLLNGSWGDEGEATKALPKSDGAATKPKTAPANDDAPDAAPKAQPKKRPPPADDDGLTRAVPKEEIAKAKAAAAKAAEPDDGLDDDERELLAKLAAKKAAKAAAAAGPAVSKAFSDDDIELTTTPKAEQAKVAAKQAARKAAAEADDGEIILPSGKGKPKVESAPKKEPAKVSADTSSLMGRWSDDDE